MIVLNVRNVQEALPAGIKLLQEVGIKRDSRNGPVLVAPCPVATVYQQPQERVIFWPERDANPFFHLYESLWMLAGRNDVAPLVRYAKNMANYSDDGKTLHGAYGYRWRNIPGEFSSVGFDQLQVIARQLQANPTDRRCVLQMWDASLDLGGTGKDVPCNLTATFQINHHGQLDMSVFCRSNDIIWGAYGANAVHFSMLQEYMAIWIGVPIGTYTQISVNYHAYDNELFAKLKDLPKRQPVFVYRFASSVLLGYDIKEIDVGIRALLANVDDNFPRGDQYDVFLEKLTFFKMAYYVLLAHYIYKHEPGVNRFKYALNVLKLVDGGIDWVVAAREWFERREKKANGTT